MMVALGGTEYSVGALQSINLHLRLAYFLQNVTLPHTLQLSAVEILIIENITVGNCRIQ